MKLTNMVRIHIVIALLAALILSAGSADAESGDKKANRERSALRKMQLMQKQLADEKAQLQNEKTQLEKDKTDLTQKVVNLTADTTKIKQSVAAADKKKNALAQEVEAMSKQNAELEEKLKDARKKLEELNLNHKETTQTLSEREIQKKTLESTLAQQAGEINSCESKNLKLYELNTQILAKYKDKNFLDGLLQAEPITQIKSVEIENILQEYRDKLDSQKIEHRAGSK